MEVYRILISNYRKVLNILELVFFYINQTSSKFIEKTGFNFSANWKFYVEYIGENYVLRQKACKEILPQNFFDEQGCITNITAIVGENGSGKTTLLNMLLDYHGSVKHKKPNSIYNDYFMEKYEKDKTLAIYLEEGDLVCYHNIDNFVNETKVREVYLQQGSLELAEIVRDNKAFENISKISVSNSMYSLDEGVSTHESIGKISLNVNSLKTLKSIFYKKKCKKDPQCVGEYYEIQDIVCNAKKENEFQQILDMLYLQYINKNNIESVFAKNIVGTLEIKFQTVTKLLEDRYTEFAEEKNKDLPLRKYFNVMNNKILAKFDSDLKKKDIFVVAYINLLYELLVYCKKNEDDSEQSINNKEELVKYISDMIAGLLEQNDSYAEIFRDNLKEIQEYDNVLANCRMNPCALPLSDFAYVSYKEIEYKSKEYDRFLELIKKSVYERKHSYVLKYIDIGGLRLASGERALLNFFSWIHMVPYFNYMSNDVEESLRENVLLLIDEIDLYCHPLWQQKLLNYLIKEIKAEYSDKRVQIIFTTHSPIVLSDMPRSNVIFLKKEKDKCQITETDIHEETFGANIYKLFDDAFFLGKKEQIGEFAKEKIQAIIDKIKPDTSGVEGVCYPSLTDDEVCLLEQQIALIGEKIIREKLYEMLYKCKYNFLDLRQKKINIYKEKIKRLQDEEDI